MSAKREGADMTIACKLIATCAAGALVVGVVLPARAADQAPAPAAMPAVTCSNFNWTHGWLDHGGWGGWGYQDGLIINGWPDNCSSAVGVGPYAYAPRQSDKDQRPKR